MELGAAAARDVPRLVELLGILFAQEHELSPDPDKQRRALELILADASRARIYVAREGGKLEAQRFAAARGQQREHVLARQGIADDFLLQRPERTEAEVLLQQREERRRGMHRAGSVMAERSR